MDVIDLRRQLIAAFDEHLRIDQCLYTAWPDYPNNGDHFITVASVLYLLDRKVKIHAITRQHVEREPEPPPGCPIVVQGGGNLGDIWPLAETHRLRLIERFPDRRIIIMPQSICFRDPAALKRSASAYNRHGRITLFTREQASYDIARAHFTGCNVVLCPDSAFYLADIIGGISRELMQGDGFLMRGDAVLTVPQAVAAVDAATPRQPWMKAFFELGQRLETLPDALYSLSVLLGSMLQLARLDHLYTERLHGHILACMMGVKNTLIPVNYHKNDSTFETWTKGLEVASRQTR